MPAEFSLGRPLSTKVLPFVWLLAIGLSPIFAWAEDWPAYRRDTTRSAISTETLPFPLRLQWTYRPGQAPSPAWPEPGRALNIMDFDYAFQPVVADGIVYFGSSSDDAIRALDAETGRLLWTFVSGGPIRFAPQVDSGRVYFGSDDGHAYCLDAKGGEVIWRFRGGLDNRQFIAQGRLTSRWPARSGVLVRDEIAYVTMGMWPSEGVFLYALNALTGKQIWCNDTAYTDYIPYPHEPSVAFGGPAPQGYSLAHGDVLVIPTGRSAPAGYDLQTGKLLYYNAGEANRGGTHLVIGHERVFTATVAWQPDQSVRLGESPPHRADSMAAIQIETGREEWPYTKPIKSHTDQVQGPRWRSEIGGGIYGRQRAIFAGDSRLYTMGNGRVDAFELAEGQAQPIWSLEQPRVYSEALTANALLLGQAGAIVAVDPATGDQLWRASVDGQIRGLAISDRRIVASNELGELFCFAETNAAPQVIAESDGKETSQEDHSEVADLLRDVPPAAIQHGYALVIGEPDTQLAKGLAERTGLHVVSLLEGEDEVQAARQRLHAETSLLGSRMSVIPIAGAGAERELPLVPYFANLIVASGEADHVPANELYRVLRPCGGIMTFVQGATPGRVLAGADIPAQEFRNGLVVRGKLKGAFDWDSSDEVDYRVRWPLEFQWFGDPGPQLIMPRHARPPTPIAAGGRMFVFGEYHVTAVDAYNGTQLWRRRLNPATIRESGQAFADDDFLYLRRGRMTAKFDAATGRLISTHQPISGPSVHDATKPLVFPSVEREDHSGTIEIDARGEELKITLTTHTPGPSVDDAWELAFDFRPPHERLDAPGPGTFELILEPSTATLRKHPTFAHPAVQIEHLEHERQVSVVRLSIPWQSLEEQTGRRPTSFCLAADLKLWKEDFRLGVWARPLVTDRYFLNDAEAIFTLQADRSSAEDNSDILSQFLPVPIAKSLPPHVAAESRQPLMMRLDGNKDMRDASGNPWHSTPRAGGFELIQRQSPLTLESGWRDYSRSYGCSGFSCSATMDFFRSGTIGVYDRADDSGMRNISGIRSGCGLTLVPALGVLLYSESAADCLCGYSFATSLAMAPVEHRRNEDWALFHQKQMNPGQIRQSALNFGAPGDRRDEGGVLWLGYPRPSLAVESGYTIDLPYRLKHLPGYGPRRINGDRQSFGSSRDWIYASQSHGISEIEMDMIYYHPREVLVSVDEEQPPTIDGDLSDPCWNGFGAVTAPHGNGSYYFRHDTDNLYVAYQQKSQRDRRGRATPWKASITERDGPIDRDDHIRFSFRNLDDSRIMTLGVTAGGEVYDSILDFAADLPPISGITIDGQTDDWPQDKESQTTTVSLPEEARLEAGWNEQGLVLLLDVPRDFNGGDGVTLGGIALLVGQAGSARMQQLTMDFSAGSLQARGWEGEQATEPRIQAMASGALGRRIEALVPWDGLELRGEPGETVRLAIRYFNPREPFFTDSRPAPFTSARERTSEIQRNRGLTFRLSSGVKGQQLQTERRRNHYGYLAYDLVTHTADRPQWDGHWTSKVFTSEDFFQAEMAIPWSTLEEAGLSRERLQLNLHKPPHASGGQDQVLPLFDRQSIMIHAVPQPPPARYTVRLHFAELDDVAAGERVFDVVLQDQVVLENLDVVHEARGRYRPLVKEFTDVTADQIMHLKLIPKGNPLDKAAVPVLSGMEVLQQ